MIEAALSGLSTGGAYALVGIALVLMYRLAAVMNIAVAVFGALGAFAMVDSYDRGWGLWASVLIGLLVGSVVSALMGQVMSWLFSEADQVTRSVATIGMAITLLAVSFRLFGDTPRSFPTLFSNSSMTISGVAIKATSAFAIALALGLAAALSVFLNRTRSGVRMVAVSELPVSAELLGIPARRYTVLVWLVAGVVATIAPILSAPTRQADFTSLSLLVVPGLASALLGSFSSFGLTVVGGILIGILEAVALRWDFVGSYRSTLPFILILLILMWSKRGEEWDESR